MDLKTSVLQTADEPRPRINSHMVILPKQSPSVRLRSNCRLLADFFKLEFDWNHDDSPAASLQDTIQLGDRSPIVWHVF